MVVPAMAQPKESCECAFGPQKGQWEFTLNIGQNQFFNDAAGLYYLLPSEDGSAVGIGVNAGTLDVNGGLGNDHFKSATNQTPRYAQPGEEGQENWFILELKVLADVGLVGFPNADRRLRVLTSIISLCCIFYWDISSIDSEGTSSREVLITIMLQNYHIFITDNSIFNNTSSLSTKYINI